MFARLRAFWDRLADWLAGPEGETFEYPEEFL